MAEPAILTWNVPNWITVVLMVLVASLVLGAISQTIKAQRAKSAPASGS